MADTDSILTSIKKLLGIQKDYTHFDQDIIIHINSVFMTLGQLGVGPEEGFAIEDDLIKWTDYIPESPILHTIKSYMYLKVRLLFDPPSSSIAVESMNRIINEFEWRINLQAEQTNTNVEEEIQNGKK